MMNIRVLILLWTGDYPAQHEVGKFIKHGILPCRRDKLKGINNEDRKTVRASKSRSSGYTGLTIFYRLHKLYRFDIFKDLVVDTMHNIPTNVIAAQLKNFTQTMKIDAAKVEERLKLFPWSAGMYMFQIKLSRDYYINRI